MAAHVRIMYLKLQKLGAFSPQVIATDIQGCEALRTALCARANLIDSTDIMIHTMKVLFVLRFSFCNFTICSTFHAKHQQQSVLLLLQGYSRKGRASQDYLREQ